MISIPRRWHVAENVPDLMGKGVRVFVDGVEVRRVVAFDLESGVVVARCLSDCWGTGSGRVHRDPASPGHACNVQHEGAVHVLPPWEGDSQ